MNFFWPLAESRKTLSFFQSTMNFKHFVGPLINPNEKIVLASLEHEGKTIATIECKWVADSRELFVIYLRNDTRSTITGKICGVGSTLISKVEALFNPAKTRLTADSGQGMENNKKLIKYYESLGFVLCPRIENGEEINEMTRIFN